MYTTIKNLKPAKDLRNVYEMGSTDLDNCFANKLFPSFVWHNGKTFKSVQLCNDAWKRGNLGKLLYKPNHKKIGKNAPSFSQFRA